MHSLFFITLWEKDKTRTWSGTTWGIFSALQKHYSVVNINLSEKWDRLHHLFCKLSSRFGLLLFNKCLRKLVQWTINYKGKPPYSIFQFEEIISNSSLYKTYIYQDLSADYLYYMYHYLPNTFLLSGLRYYSEQAIRQRKIQQDRYYQSCSGIFTMGQWLRNDLINRSGIDPSKVHHVGGGINLDVSLIDGSRKSGNKILFVGRDYIGKGLGITVEAFIRLKQILSNVELYVAGPTNDPYKHQEILGYHFCGYCNHTELSELFNKCDIFCMPSYFEAYGLVFIEALTYGLPCIGRNCYEMPYFIQEGETGFLIDKDDPILLAGKMKEALTNLQIRQNVINQRPYYIKEYSWDSVAARIKQYLEA